MTDSPSDTSEGTVPPINPVLIDAWNKAVDLVEQLPDDTTILEYSDLLGQCLGPQKILTLNSIAPTIFSDIKGVALMAFLAGMQFQELGGKLTIIPREEAALGGQPE